MTYFGRAEQDALEAEADYYNELQEEEIGTCKAEHVERFVETGEIE